MSGDFTSARFLGFGMPATAAVPNLGKPAVLAEPPGAAEVAARIAAGQRIAAGLVARSSLHGLIDVLTGLAADSVVLLDEHCYPISRWAAHAVKKGVDMLTYRHHDANHVRGLLRQVRRPAAVVVDAWCSGCLEPAPLAELAELAASTGSRLVVDDSLAFGVLGNAGSGTPAWLGVPHSRLVWVASAGKAYGAAVAVITGTSPDLARVQRLGPNRTHSSPAPSGEIAVLAAALDDPMLAARRRRLAANTQRLRHGLESSGLHTWGDPLPVVALDVPGVVSGAVHAGLRQRGIDIALVRSGCRGGSHPTFCVRADHSTADIDDALEAVRLAVGWAA